MKINLYAMAFCATTMLAVSPAQARNYDCSKAGNANKAVCKGNAASASAMAPAAKAAPMIATKPAERHYDCTKTGNANKAVCKGSLNAAPATSTTATKPHWWSKSPGSAPSSVRTMQSLPPAASANAAGPQGATAKCKDGSFSHSMHHSGSCSHHGGVAQFF